MFRTQGWDARGPRVGGGHEEEVSVSIGVLGQKEFYETRAGCEWISSILLSISYSTPENYKTQKRANANSLP